MSLFVTFEGPDGAGKSTQIELVARRLEAHGLSVVKTREPGGTPLGERVRAVLLDPGDCAIVPRAEALLMTAARAQHVADVIVPALSDGRVVLCDRFSDSTLAYQGAGRGLPTEKLNMLQAFATDGLQPDLTILLDISAENGLERRRSSGTPMNRLDQDSLAFHERVREWYVQEAKAHPERWVLLEAGRAQDDLADEICQVILDRSGEAAARADANRKSE
ncbi:MAG: dTMP kinase [Sphaerobacteraceae bacterium]|nr:MAG: dTMP kinase [Sphaerobacteraceae bacterium]